VAEQVDIVVVGAGMGGLGAAASLAERGRGVVVLEKSRGVGGRLAGRRFAGAAFDMGPQYITGRGLAFSARVQAWRSKGRLVPWFHGGPAREDGDLMVWTGLPAMTALAKDMAQGLDVRLEHKAQALRPIGLGWLVEVEGREDFLARAVVCTAPLPQSLALLDAGGVSLEAAVRGRLEAVRYASCLVVMARLAGPSQVPPPGLVEPIEGPLLRVVDNVQKGLSAAPAVTLQSTPEFSAAWLDGNRHEAARLMLAAARPLLGAEVLEWQLHAWRHSQPENPLHDLHVEPSTCPPLLLAGDAFAGARVEDALRSGIAAARRLDEVLELAP
jgi:predicted NAD/FAD-dependent oxidoreductase